MVSDPLKKVKSWAKENQTDLYTALVIVLVGMISFGLGRLSVLWQEKPEVRVEERGSIEVGGKSVESLNNSTTAKNGGVYVASKSGNAYHFPYCPGALKIREENKIWFSSKEEAEKKGYHPAGNCPGL